MNKQTQRIKANRDKQQNHPVLPKNKFLPDLFSSILLTTLSVLFILMCNSYNHIQDDAFITFRYVENLINGRGLVFNVGENVEGFTSILWVLILSAANLLGIDLIHFAQYSGIAFGICSIWLTFYITRIFFDNIHPLKSDKVKVIDRIFYSAINILPAAMLTFTGAFQYWAISGMEVTLFISLALVSIYFYIRSIQSKTSLLIFSIFISITSLARPEGVLLFSAIIINHWIDRLKNSCGYNLKLFFKSINEAKERTPLLIFLATNFVLFLFRIFYYGYPLPNTFYAKTGISYEYLISGLAYLQDFFKTYLLYGALFVAAALYYFKKDSRNYFWLLSSIIMMFFIYTILVGGDVLPLFRFVLPILPFIYLLFIAVLIRSSQLVNEKLRTVFKHFVPVATIVLTLIIIYYNYAAPSERIEKFAFYESHLVKKMSATGRWLSEKQAVGNNELIVAASTIGAVSYYSQVKLIDMLGLTDETIAHHPKPLKVISGEHTGWKERNYNTDYLLAQKPDYIYFSTGIKPSAYAERALFLSEDFTNNYYPYFFNSFDDYVETIYKRKNPATEKNQFSRFLDNPDFDSNYVNLYNQFLNIKNRSDLKEEAFSLCQKILKSGPVNFTAAKYQLGLYYESERNIEKAFEIIKEAADKDDYFSPAHFYLGRHYAVKKNYPLAKFHFELVQKYNPEYFEYRTRRKTGKN